MGHVEQAVIGGSARKGRPQSLQIEVRCAGGRIGQATLEVVGHGVTSSRSRRRPALTFWRAASSLMPIRAPISA